MFSETRLTANSLLQTGTWLEVLLQKPPPPRSRATGLQLRTRHAVARGAALTLPMAACVHAQSFQPPKAAADLNDREDLASEHSYHTVKSELSAGGDLL